MRVFSKIVCGFRSDGRVLLHKGENVLTEPLTSTERAFIDAMKTVGVVTELDAVPTAPVSETKIKVTKPKTSKPRSKTSTRVDVERKPMRTRRAAVK